MWSGSTCRSARDHAVAKTYTECTVTRFSGRISVTFSKTPSSPMPEHTAAAVDPAKNATLVLMVPTVPICIADGRALAAAWRLTADGRDESEYMH